MNQWMTALFYICCLKKLVVPTATMLAEVVLWAAAAILTKVIRTQAAKINTLEVPIGNCLQPVT